MAATAPLTQDSASAAKAALLSVLTCTVAAICCKVLSSAFRTQRSCKQMAATAPPIYDSGSMAKAAFLSVLTCTVAAICCKILSSAFRTQRSCKQMAATAPPIYIGLRFNGQICLSFLTCTVAAICRKIQPLHFELKGLANRWQQPRLQFRTPLQRSKLPCFLSSPARLPQSVAKSNLCISNSKVLQTDGSNRASNSGLRFNGQSCLSFFSHLHGCRNLSQNPTSAFRTQRSCKQMAATAPPI